MTEYVFNLITLSSSSLFILCASLCVQVFLYSPAATGGNGPFVSVTQTEASTYGATSERLERVKHGGCTGILHCETLRIHALQKYNERGRHSYSPLPMKHKPTRSIPE